MELISKEEFDGWKNQLVTKAFYGACKERINDYTQALVSQAGINSEMDNFMRGVIQAYREVLAFHIADEEEESSEGED